MYCLYYHVSPLFAPFTPCHAVVECGISTLHRVLWMFKSNSLCMRNGNLASSFYKHIWIVMLWYADWNFPARKFVLFAITSLIFVQCTCFTYVSCIIYFVLLSIRPRGLACDSYMPTSFIVSCSYVLIYSCRVCALSLSYFPWVGLL